MNHFWIYGTRGRDCGYLSCPIMHRTTEFTREAIEDAPNGLYFCSDCGAAFSIPITEKWTAYNFPIPIPVKHW